MNQLDLAHDQHLARVAPLNADEYDRFVDASPQGNIFAKSWWLNAVAPDQHQILFVRNGADIQAAWPIALKRMRGVGNVITTPLLTPYLGPLFRPQPNTKTAQRLSNEKEWCEALIQQLPRFAVMRITCHHAFTYWLPFYWQAFKQTTHYTYILPNLSDLDAVWSGFRENIRREIKKATKQGIAVVEGNFDDFLALHRMTFDRQNIPMPYSDAYARRLDAATAAAQARKIFIAREAGGTGQPHAAVFLVWDKKAAYYLMGGGDPELRTSGATSLAMWEAIKFAATVSQSFDFDGSMIEPIERFFRAYGAQPQPHFEISKMALPIITPAMHRGYKLAQNTYRALRKRGLL
jgi:lipid II:glycine glycyltransferase (peptidoglycan interpeptide bridge formation enzyme)